MGLYEHGQGRDCHRGPGHHHCGISDDDETGAERVKPGRQSERKHRSQERGKGHRTEDEVEEPAVGRCHIHGQFGHQEHDRHDQDQGQNGASHDPSLYPTPHTV